MLVLGSRKTSFTIISELRVAQRRDMLPTDRMRARFAGEFLVAIGDVRDLLEGYKKPLNRITTAHRCASFPFSMLSTP